jgi:outer membrane phospholipase A
MGKARQDLQYSADVQQVADSLVGVGWNHVSSGSSTIRGRPVSWIVTTASASSQKLDILVQRRGQASQTTVYQDTVTLFLAKDQLQ